MTGNSLTLFLDDEPATVAVGRRLASALPSAASSAPLVIWLSGPLGAGKTTLARAMLRALGVTGTVRSPTFTLIETYPCGPLEVVHVDLYRIDTPAAVAGLGLREYHRPNVVWLVEWPLRGEGQLPAADLHLQLSPVGDSGQRELLCQAATPAGRRLIAGQDAADSCESD